jgi:hypothetical protein
MVCSEITCDCGDAIERCRTEATKALRELSSRDTGDRLTFVTEHGVVDNLIAQIIMVPGETDKSARIKVLSAVRGNFDAATAWLPKTTTNSTDFKCSAICSSPGCSSIRGILRAVKRSTVGKCASGPIGTRTWLTARGSGINRTPLGQLLSLKPEFPQP